MTGILNTNGDRVDDYTASFDNFDTIRYSPERPNDPVVLGMRDAGKISLADELGTVSATIYLSNTGSNLVSGDGADTLIGGSGRDILNAGRGNDSINGNKGDDYLVGGDGNDTIDGADGNDIIRGGSGNDAIKDESGSTRDINAGSGNDTIVVHDFDTAGDRLGGTIDGGTGIDRLYFDGNFGDLHVSNVENLITGSSRVTGAVSQFATFEKIWHTDGQTNIDNQVQIYLTSGGNLNLSTKLGFQSVDIHTSDASTSVTTGTGDDILTGGKGNDFLRSSDGADSIEGVGGNDTLDGGRGDDSLDGGSGDDRLSGGAGNDYLYGNVGRDGFVFNTALNISTNVDTVALFKPVDDTIILDDAVFKAFKPGAIGADDFVIGAKATTAAQNLIYDSTNGNLYYDADGTGPSAQTLFAHLNYNLKLSSGDFLVE